MLQSILDENWKPVITIHSEIAQKVRPFQVTLAREQEKHQFGVNILRSKKVKDAKLFTPRLNNLASKRLVSKRPVTLKIKLFNTVKLDGSRRGFWGYKDGRAPKCGSVN